MSSDQVYVAVGIVGGLLVIIGTLWKALPAWTRFWSRLNGTFDAVAGRPAFTDPASGKQVEALPPLTTRLATVESAVVEMKDLMQQLVDVDRRLGEHDRRLAEHDAAIAALGAGHLGQIERIVTRAESAQQWRAIADAHENPPDDN